MLKTTNTLQLVNVAFCLYSRSNLVSREQWYRRRKSTVNCKCSFANWAYNVASDLVHYWFTTLASQTHWQKFTSVTLFLCYAVCLFLKPFFLPTWIRLTYAHLYNALLQTLLAPDSFLLDVGAKCHLHYYRFLSIELMSKVYLANTQNIIFNVIIYFFTPMHNTQRKMWNRTLWRFPKTSSMLNVARNSGIRFFTVYSFVFTSTTLCKLL